VDSLDQAVKATGILLSILAGLALCGMFLALAWETFSAF
jgi:hypothetical protein